MKYVPIWVPVILILGLVAVRLYRPLPVGDGAGARGAATICDFAITVVEALQTDIRDTGR